MSVPRGVRPLGGLGSRRAGLDVSDPQLKARYRGRARWSFANPLLITGSNTVLFGAAFSSYYVGSTKRRDLMDLL